MGKKNKTGLGRTLIRDRFGGSKNRRTVDNNSMLHTAEINDGYDWGRLNLQSVTEQSSFQEFLSTAELAGTEFEAEKLNVTFVSAKTNVGLLTEPERENVAREHEKFRSIIKIPRRPKWDSTTTPVELQALEQSQFLEWRRELALLQEEKDVMMTPYEKNLEFWRQLWRVIEKSDVIVQIVDARNPLLFKCEDLERYVLEVSDQKINLILMNKADFLTEKQRDFWSNYFTKINMKVIFFSAFLSGQKLQTIEDEDESNDDDEANQQSKRDGDTSEHDDKIAEMDESTKKLDDLRIEIERDEISGDKFLNSNRLVSHEELIQIFQTIHAGRKKVTSGITTIGLVGYPNVGKSSTINALMRSKRVSVSATPGKTKHFQTLFLREDLLLCDCPGLVMPSFVFTKAEMVISGVLPVHQMTDHAAPVNLICHQLPRHVLERKYGILIPRPLEGEDPLRPPTYEEFLYTHAYNRGFMTANGQPDGARSARHVIKDYLQGRLCYAHAPPDVPQDEYMPFPAAESGPGAGVFSERHVQPAREVRAARGVTLTTEDFDRKFFRDEESGRAKVKGIPGKLYGTSASATTDKPTPMEVKLWKKENKHKNKNRKEKLRRVYAHLDEH